VIFIYSCWFCTMQAVFVAVTSITGTCCSFLFDMSKSPEFPQNICFGAQNEYCTRSKRCVSNCRFLSGCSEVIRCIYSPLKQCDVVVSNWMKLFVVTAVRLRWTGALSQETWYWRWTGSALNVSVTTTPSARCGKQFNIPGTILHTLLRRLRCYWVA